MGPISSCHSGTGLTKSLPLSSLPQCVKKSICIGLFRECWFKGILLGSKEHARPSVFARVAFLPFVLRDEDPSTGEVRRFWGCLDYLNLKTDPLLRELMCWNVMTSLVFTSVVRLGPLAGAILTQSHGSNLLYGEGHTPMSLHFKP
jgi:hypothetical protein